MAFLTLCGYLQTIVFDSTSGKVCDAMKRFPARRKFLRYATLILLLTAKAIPTAIYNVQ